MASAIDINVAVEEALVCEISRLRKRVKELEEALDAAHAEIDALFNMISD